jgi:hypothetical protein
MPEIVGKASRLYHVWVHLVLLGESLLADDQLFS